VERRLVTKRVIIDTDPGIDDTAAILFALGSPEIQVEALTTVFGNVSVEQCTINALRILEAAGREDIPVYQGSGKPFGMGEPAFAQYIHGSDGLGDSDAPEPTTSAQSQNAVIEIIERVLASPGEITLLAIGRLTNVALAINVEPAIVDAIDEVIVMGGAVTVPGNVTPVATANIWGDPQAADVVYRSGVKVVQVGLDVCRKVEFSPEQLARTWSADTGGTRLLQGAVSFIQQAYNRRGRLTNPEGAQFNDVPAMGYAIAPSLYTMREGYVRVEYLGEMTRGQTVADFEEQTGNPANATVAMDVDVQGLTELWVERVSGLGSA